MAKYLNIQIEVYFLENKFKSNIAKIPEILTILFNEGGSKTKLNLYFRPGHYDIAYNESHSKKVYEKEMMQN